MCYKLRNHEDRSLQLMCYRLQIRFRSRRHALLECLAWENCLD